MNKRKVGVITALLALIAVGASSCGGSNSSDGRIKIPFWTTFDKHQQSKIESLADEIEAMIFEKEGVKVDVVPSQQGGYNEIELKMTRAFSSGKLPTIAVAYPDHVATYLQQEKQANKKGEYVVRLDDLINDPVIGIDKEPELCDQSINDFVPSFIDEGRHYVYEGTYSLPYMKSTEIMLYNKGKVAQILEKMNIKDSVTRYMSKITWDQLMDMLVYVNEHRSDFGMENTADDEKFPLFYDSDANMFITQCYQRGIDYIDLDRETGKGQILFDNPEAIALLEELNKMHQDGLLITKLTNQNQYGSDYFKNENCIFTVGSTGGSGYSDPGENFEVGVCKFPTYKDSTEEQKKYVSQGVTLCLFSNPSISKEENDAKIKYAWKFMKFITNPINSADSCMLSNGYIPARVSAYESNDYAAYLELANENDYMATCAKTVIEDINGKYFNYPVFAGSSTARAEVGKLVNDCLRISKAEPTADITKLVKKAVENVRTIMPA